MPWKECQSTAHVHSNWPHLSCRELDPSFGNTTWVSVPSHGQPPQWRPPVRALSSETRPSRSVWDPWLKPELRYLSSCNLRGGSRLCFPFQISSDTNRSKNELVLSLSPSKTTPLSLALRSSNRACFSGSGSFFAPAVWSPVTASFNWASTYVWDSNNSLRSFPTWPMLGATNNLTAKASKTASVGGWFGVPIANAIEEKLVIPCRDKTIASWPVSSISLHLAWKAAVESTRDIATHTRLQTYMCMTLGFTTACHENLNACEFVLTLTRRRISRKPKVTC